MCVGTPPPTSVAPVSSGSQGQWQTVLS
jgi:hypothetical protein